MHLRQAIIHEIVEEPGKVVLHVGLRLCIVLPTGLVTNLFVPQATGSAQSITGHAYTNEWMLTYHLVQGEENDKLKISLIKEFFDSESMASFVPAEMERVKKLQGEAH